MASEHLKGKFQSLLDLNLKFKAPTEFQQEAIWDRDNKTFMENYSVFIKKDNGEYERKTLDAHLEELEKLDDVHYIEAMNQLFLNHEIFYYDPEATNTTAFSSLTLEAKDIEFDDAGVLQPRNPFKTVVRDPLALEAKVNAYQSKIDPNQYIAAINYFEGRAEERKKEIENPQFLAEKAIVSLKEKEEQAKERLGTAKKEFDNIFSVIHQSQGNKKFDRYDLESRDKFFVMEKSDDGTMKKRPFANYIADAEALSPEEYKIKMTELLEQRNIMVAEEGNFMPSAWGFQQGTNEISVNLRASSRLFEPEGATEEEKASFKSTMRISNQDKKLKITPEEDRHNLIENYDFYKESDLPEPEKTPWYLKISFFRSIALSISKTARETYRRINSINEAHNKRQAFAEYMNKEKSQIVAKALKAAGEFVESQNAQYEQNLVNKNALKEKEKEIKEAQNIMQKTLEKEGNTVKSYGKIITQQADSNEMAGWRIQNLLGEHCNAKGFKSYQIDTEKLPKNAEFIADARAYDNFTKNNQTYFNFAKLLATAYSPKEGGEAQKAIKNTIPQDMDMKSVPPTFLARQLINDVFSGKTNENAQKFIEPLIIEAKESANYSIEQNNQGNQKPMADDIRAGATILLRVLNSTTPEEFADQSSKWPLAAKCVKELVEITQNCPDIVEESPISNEMLNEMKGWAKVSDAITNSAKAKKKLLGNDTLSLDTREKIWNEIFLESKLRGLCVNTYKSNGDIEKSIMEKAISDDNLFGKEMVKSEFAYSNENAKAICALGQDDKLMQNIKNSVDVTIVKSLGNKTLCASWIAGHLKHNNEMNAEMVGKMVQSMTNEKSASAGKVKEEEKQLKSNRDMLSMN